MLLVKWLSADPYFRVCIICFQTLVVFSELIYREYTSDRTGVGATRK